MLNLIDTHAHLDADAFASDLDEVLLHAQRAGVSRIFTIGITLETSRRAVELAEAHEHGFRRGGHSTQLRRRGGPDRHGGD